MKPKPELSGRRDGDGHWTLTFPCLPVGVNHQYFHLPGGGRVLTPEARAFRDDAAVACMMARFVPSRKARYAVEIDFTMPDWKRDADGPIKLVLDSMIGVHCDHRVIRLVVTKRVVPGVEQTEVRIMTVEED